MTKTVGFIGSGMIGGSLARLAVSAGLNVVMSNSRGPETLSELVAEIGELARAATPTEAAEAGDLVVATIPLHAYTALPAAALAGKTVIDTMNYYPDRDQRMPQLDSGELTNSAMVQQHLADSRVVKACNNIVFHHLLALARPADSPERSALPIASDSAEAKDQVSDFLNTVGYDTVDVGTLADSWRSQTNTPVYCKPYMPEVPKGMSREETAAWIFQSVGIPAPASKIKALVEAAVPAPPGGNFEFFSQP